ncbi:tissue factor isoform 2-T2 [Leptodactylus fuscus]|uniref:tissue factor isoform X2 n=1 Tax=Leptodactylus fuscus TaxID=238119 RepID=UPI003F4EFD8A
MLSLHIVLLVTVFCWQGTSAQGANFPTATKIMWSSINLKNIIDWEPKPTNYTYTVMIRNQYFQDWKKKCIYTKETTCEVTDLMKDVNATYEIRIVSEDKNLDTVEEPPYAEGPSFTPSDQTIIGKPVIHNFTLNRDTLTVLVKDTLSPYRYPNNTLIPLRDFFPNNFEYTLFYRKASSTGKKQQSSSTNEIVVKVDKGESYCFFVQALVPSRKQNRVSENSLEMCTSSDGGAASGFLPSTGFLCLSNLILLYWLL